MVTAGHCGVVGTSWQSQQGGHYYGGTTNRVFPNKDMAMIYGSDYRGRIWVTNTQTRAVSGAAQPVVGLSYCWSGAVTGAICGNTLTTLSGDFCDPNNVCVYGIAKFNGTAPSDGDSGAPVYINTGANNKVSIRGIISARQGSSIGVMEPWNRITGQWNTVSIITE